MGKPINTGSTAKPHLSITIDEDLKKMIRKIANTKYNGNMSEMVKSALVSEFKKKSIRKIIEG